MRATKRHDWRRPYYGSAAFDTSCRPHGDCPWCVSNRTYQRRRADEEMRQELNDWMRGGGDAQKGRMTC